MHELIELHLSPTSIHVRQPPVLSPALQHCTELSVLEDARLSNQFYTELPGPS